MGAQGVYRVWGREIGRCAIGERALALFGVVVPCGVSLPSAVKQTCTWTLGCKGGSSLPVKPMSAQPSTLQTQDNAAAKPGTEAKPTQTIVTYICGNCGLDVEVKPGDIIRCRECGYRILFKKRAKKPMQY